MPANYEATKKAKLERSVSIDEAKYGAALWCLRSFEPLITKRIDSSNKFELVGFNISELVDFLLGFTTYDLMNDDLKSKIEEVEE